MNEYKSPREIFPDIATPKGLSLRIVTAVAHYKRRQARKRFAIFSVLLLASTVALVPATEYALQELATSSFLELLSLITTDTGSLVIYWREFGLSLLETLPVIGTTIVLSMAFTLLASLYKLAQNVRPAFLSATFA